jgi:hypothetical protein
MNKKALIAALEDVASNLIIIACVIGFGLLLTSIFG